MHSRQLPEIPEDYDRPPRGTCPENKTSYYPGRISGLIEVKGRLERFSIVGSRVRYMHVSKGSMLRLLENTAFTIGVVIAVGLTAANIMLSAED